MLNASHLTKAFGSIKVLNDISIEVGNSEIVSIVGKSGAGKSTLLQILGTLDKPDSGSVIINNVDVSKLNSNQLSKFRNQNIGFIFQFHNLLPEFTAIENVAIPGFLASKNKDVVFDEASKLMTRLGLANRLHHKPSALSGGEQQRVSIARALLNQPSIIFADEPTGNLDSKNASEIHELFLELRTEYKITFVIVTHNEALAMLADRCMTIENGNWRQ